MSRTRSRRGLNSAAAAAVVLLSLLVTPETVLPAPGGAGNGGGGSGGSASHGSGNGGGGGSVSHGAGNGGGQANGNGATKANNGSNSNAVNGGQGNTGANGVGSASSKLSNQAGGVVSAGSVAITVPAGALAGAAGGSATITVQPAVNVPTPGGPVRFSPNGTLADITITDDQAVPLTTFPVPITLALKYNAADLAMSAGDARQMSVAFVVDANTPPLENPLHFPVGTFLLAPNVANDVANGLLTVQTQALGSVVAVVANPLSYVQTLQPSTPLYSSFEPTASVTLSSTPQFKVLQPVVSQIGSRLFVLDPDTGNYAYVDAASVGPSGPPTNSAPAGVTRGLLGFLTVNG